MPLPKIEPKLHMLIKQIEVALAAGDDKVELETVYSLVCHVANLENRIAMLEERIAK